MKLSLTKHILGSEFVKNGVISSSDGTLFKAYASRPFSSGAFESNFDGPLSETFFNKLSELLSRLPNFFEGQILFVRKKIENEILGFQTKIFFFERVQKAGSYSHFKALFEELKHQSQELDRNDWHFILSQFFSSDILQNSLPDLIWEKDHLQIKDNAVKILSLTELPQLTWKGCFQDIFEYPEEFILSLKFNVPDRAKIKRQLETKRRVSHALSISTSLEVKNIESNSVLHSSEETLERILVGKETFFEISTAIILNGKKEQVGKVAYDFERVISGIGNAGLFKESVGNLPVFKSHLPGNKTLSIRKLPLLSSNLSEIFPLFLDFTIAQDQSSLELRSRSLEKSHLNVFSSGNLNFSGFICGSSGSGKSFLMNAILLSQLKDEPQSRLCVFDVGGSYRRLISKHGGQNVTLTFDEAQRLISTYFKTHKVSKNGFFKILIELLCGGGSHITHSHRVAIEDILSEFEDQNLKLADFIKNAQARSEKCYHDLALWLKPHLSLDQISVRSDLYNLIKSQVSSFDFKELDAHPIIQKVTVFLLCELLWQDLLSGRFPKTLIVFDEVWRFFSSCKQYLEEFYRTLRKYRAGIFSVTQNLADYGDDAFSKMIFTNSYTKIFLQNGATKGYLKNTFDLSDTHIQRALSVNSQKPFYSEFFALSADMSQVFRLYPTPEFYQLAQTENLTSNERNF